MRSLEVTISKIALAGIGLVALYDVLFINKGQSANALVGTVFKGYSAILARGSGQKPPPGF
jgi:hypothetical protein